MIRRNYPVAVDPTQAIAEARHETDISDGRDRRHPWSGQRGGVTRGAGAGLPGRGRARPTGRDARGLRDAPGRHGRRVVHAHAMRAASRSAPSPTAPSSSPCASPIAPDASATWSSATTTWPATWTSPPTSARSSAATQPHRQGPLHPRRQDYSSPPTTARTTCTAAVRGFDKVVWKAEPVPAARAAPVTSCATRARTARKAIPGKLARARHLHAHRQERADASNTPPPPTRRRRST